MKNEESNIIADNGCPRPYMRIRCSRRELSPLTLRRVTGVENMQQHVRHRSSASSVVKRAQPIGYQKVQMSSASSRHEIASLSSVPTQRPESSSDYPVPSLVFWFAGWPVARVRGEAAHRRIFVPTFALLCTRLHLPPTKGQQSHIQPCLRSMP